MSTQENQPQIYGPHECLMAELGRLYHKPLPHEVIADEQVDDIETRKICPYIGSCALHVEAPGGFKPGSPVRLLSRQDRGLEIPENCDQPVGQTPPEAPRGEG